VTREIRDVVFGELRDARAALRDPKLIRVTPDAIAESPVVVPMTPERARRHAAVINVTQRGGAEGLVADPRARLYELLIHPSDWRELLVAKFGGGYLVGPPTRPGEPLHAFGVPVVEH